MPHPAPLAAQQRLIAALRAPGALPGGGRVQVIETHISWVLLCGRFAWKIKKAVNLGFLDYSTLAQRRQACDEELRLNRRLAPSLYLAAVPIGGSADAPRIGSEPAIEYAVQMRRFPASALAEHPDTLARITPAHIDRFAHALAEFHAALPAAASGTRLGRAAAIARAMRENFLPLPDTPECRALQRESEAEFTACAPHFARRRKAGQVRECHGDLHLGNLILQRGRLRAFDGIEFNPSLRWIDVISELAFPVMDLIHHGRPDLAWRLLNGWLEHSGDFDGLAVLRFYLAYRATVRAKVDALRAQQAGLTPATAAMLDHDSGRYLQLARACLARPQPALILTHGLPGSGKSHFAQAALERLGAIRIRSDVERKRLFGLAPLQTSRARFAENLYSADATRRTYDRLHTLAREILGHGFPVIVDAAFLRHAERAYFAELAHTLGVPFAIADLPGELPLLRARILARQTRGGDPSEANIDVLEKLARIAEPLTSAERCIVVNCTDTARGLSNLIQHMTRAPAQNRNSP